MAGPLDSAFVASESIELGGSENEIAAEADAGQGPEEEVFVLDPMPQNPPQESRRDRRKRALQQAQGTSPLGDSLSFAELKATLGISDGNLSSHARKLEDAGYITCEKQFSGRKPLTTYMLTVEGRKALARYLTHMEALIEATREP